MEEQDEIATSSDQVVEFENPYASQTAVAPVEVRGDYGYFDGAASNPLPDKNTRGHRRRVSRSRSRELDY